ncbi:MAG: histidine phosphatase family protein [Thermomicrobia bacterium]|nr:histidine phosphatase family protein [Thermomicrobia bacterium]
MPETTRQYGRPPRPVIAPTLLTLVRHGQTTGNVRKLLSGVSDDPLTGLGRRQAAAMGTALSALILDGTLPPVHALYVSPLQRARHTAAALAKPLGLTPVLRDDLMEINFGEMEGLTEEEAVARYPDAKVAFAKDIFMMEYAFPGGETRRGFHQRAKEVFADIIARHPGEHLIVVAHGGILGVALAHYMTGNTARWSDYALANCSISRLTVQGDDVTLHVVNDVAHLAALTPEEAEAVAIIERHEEEAARD